jgi:hypothetical protein
MNGHSDQDGHEPFAPGACQAAKSAQPVQISHPSTAHQQSGQQLGDIAGLGRGTPTPRSTQTERHRLAGPAFSYDNMGAPPQPAFLTGTTG